MADLQIIENGDGGDIVLRGNDFVLVQGIENKPYLSMFGGDSDWWGNEFEDPTKPILLWTSKTESTLGSVALSSAGRLKIQQAIIDDLKSIGEQTGSEIIVDVMIAGNDRIDIKVEISNLSITYIWNPSTEYLTYKI